MRGILVSIILLIIFGTASVLLWLGEKKRTDKISGHLDTYYKNLKEKRKTIRLDKQLNVVCKVTETSGSRWSVFSKDISGEGICLHLPEMLPQDAVVDLEIDIPGRGGRVCVHGKVVWVREATAVDEKRKFDIGVQFVKVNPKHKDDLAAFIAMSLKEGGKDT